MTDYHRSSLVNQARRRRQERPTGLPGLPLLWSRALGSGVVERDDKISQPLRGLLAAAPLALFAWGVIGGLALAIF